MHGVIRLLSCKARFPIAMFCCPNERVIAIDCMDNDIIFNSLHSFNNSFLNLGFEMLQCLYTCFPYNLVDCFHSGILFPD